MSWKPVHRRRRSQVKRWAFGDRRASARDPGVVVCWPGR